MLLLWKTNPFNVFTYVGDIELYPENDNWVDTKSLNPIKGHCCRR